jgi:hypothetical protein
MIEITQTNIETSIGTIVPATAIATPIAAIGLDSHLPG